MCWRWNGIHLLICMNRNCMLELDGFESCIMFFDPLSSDLAIINTYIVSRILHFYLNFSLLPGIRGVIQKDSWSFGEKWGVGIKVGWLRWLY